MIRSLISGRQLIVPEQLILHHKPYRCIKALTFTIENKQPRAFLGGTRAPVQVTFIDVSQRGQILQSTPGTFTLVTHGHESFFKTFTLSGNTVDLSHFSGAYVTIGLPRIVLGSNFTAGLPFPFTRLSVDAVTPAVCKYSVEQQVVSNEPLLAGQALEIELRVSNIGEVDLKDLVIQTLDTREVWPVVIKPGASASYKQPSRTIQSFEAKQGYLSNAVIVKCGSLSQPNTIQVQVYDISLLVSLELLDPPAEVKAGTLLNYETKLYNPGNVDLLNVQVSGVTVPLKTILAELNVGQEHVYRSSYTVPLDTEIPVTQVEARVSCNASPANGYLKVYSASQTIFTQVTQ